MHAVAEALERDWGRAGLSVRVDEYWAVVGGGLYRISHEADCNVYLLMSRGEAALFDAGCGVDPTALIDNVRRQGAHELKYIFLTHAHADHACGAVAVRAELGGKVIASEADGHLIEDGSDYDLGLEHARRSGTYPADFAYGHCHVDVKAPHLATYDVGAHAVRTILVPSHTPGSMCYIIEGDGLRRLVTGDVVFVGGLIGLANIPGCELRAFREYLPRLAGLGVDAMFPGHLLWRLRDAQRHIDYAVEQIQLSRLPKTPPTLHV